MPRSSTPRRQRLAFVAMAFALLKGSKGPFFGYHATEAVSESLTGCGKTNVVMFCRRYCRDSKTKNVGIAVLFRGFLAKKARQ